LLITLTAGTCFLMWLGEEITDFGIGNGISIIIFAGIIARIPSQIVQTAKLAQVGEIGILPIVSLLIISVVVIGGVIAIQKGQRRIPARDPYPFTGKSSWSYSDNICLCNIAFSSYHCAIFSEFSFYESYVRGSFTGSAIISYFVCYINYNIYLLLYSNYL